MNKVRRKELQNLFDSIAEAQERLEASVTEEGILVFLPCKIGSEVYHKSFFSDIIVSSIVKEILITPYGYQVRALDSANGLRRFEKQELGVKWFVTRAEAEAAPKLEFVASHRQTAGELFGFGTSFDECNEISKGVPR